MLRWVAVGLIFGALVSGARPGAAQIPGDELGSGSRARSEYLETTYGDVKLLLAEWQESIQKNDVKRMSRNRLHRVVVGLDGQTDGEHERATHGISEVGEGEKRLEFTAWCPDGFVAGRAPAGPTLGKDILNHAILRSFRWPAGDPNDLLDAGWLGPGGP